MIKLMHIITDLDIGGAEMMLYKLLSHMDQKNFMNSVVSLKPMGPLSEPIKSLGIAVYDLKMDRPASIARGFFQLLKLILTWKPEVVQTWLYHADLVGFLTARVARIKNVVWNIRCSNMQLEHYAGATSWTVKLCSILSPFPRAVITNSYFAEEHHKGLGYKPKGFFVIPNGFDTNAFSPDAEAKRRLSRELGIGEDRRLIGLVARFDPMKDHKTFLAAASQVSARHSDVVFVLAGEGVEVQNKRLFQWVREARLGTRIYLLGCRTDIQTIMASMDIACSSSYGEGFSNVIGEAMSCGVPCVVTDVGDSARIVGETGRVVPPRNPDALAEAILELLELPGEERRGLGGLARDRIRKHYSIDKIATDYERLYVDIAGR